MGKEQSFLQMVLEKLVILHKKRNLNPYCILYVKHKPKWIIDLSVGAKAIKALEENTGKYLSDLSWGKIS